MKIAEYRNTQEQPISLLSEDVAYDMVHPSPFEAVTLAWADAMIDGKVVRLVGLAVKNPEDQLSRPVGRELAKKRLMHYLRYGHQKRHAGGHSANHFVFELTEEECKSKSKTWKQEVAEEAIKNCFFSIDICCLR